MYSYCIIPERHENFSALLTQLPVQPAEKDILGKCRITKVQVNTKENSWQIFMNVSEQLPNSLVAVIEQALCNNCGLSKVELKQRVKVLEQYLEQNWAEFTRQVADNNQTVRHMLERAKWNFDGYRLEIITNGNLSGEILSANDIPRSIKAYIAREFGRLCEVEYLAEVNHEQDGVCDEDLMTAEYLEAIQENATSNESKKEANPIIYGRNIREESRLLSDITDEERSVVVQGQVISLEVRELRSGRSLVSFEIGDLTGGISCKLFIEDQGELSKITAGLKTGMFTKVKGKVQHDNYSGELTLMANNIVRMEKQERYDRAEICRVELHAHTQMSNMDAVVSVKSLIQTAAKWGHPALAITDHGVVQAFPEAHEVAQKSGIKIIYGMEGYLFETDINQSSHIIILAKNLVGLRNLYRLVSISHLKYLHRTPRIPRKVLEEHREGLLLGSACEAGELIRAIVEGVADDELCRIASFYDYLEIQPIHNNDFLVRAGKVAGDQGLRDINRKVCQIADRLGKLVVATCDVHFLNPEDEIYRRILMAGKGFADADQQPPLYFRTTEEMLAEFAYLGREVAYQVVVENPRQINEQISRFKPIPDELYSPQIPGAEEEIRTMSQQRAEELYGTPLPEVVSARLQYELDSIINNGFAVLYLIAHKLVKKSLDDGYLVGSRGSVGSSFVATMTNITEVNPLPPHWRCPQCKYNEFITDGSYGGGFDLPDKTCPQCGAETEKNGHDIPFAVFMGFHGDKVPDIDLNFSGEYQPVAHKYTEELFGKDNVFRAGTIATIADKTAYGYVKKYFDEKGISARNAHINSLVTGCTGVKRTTGQHPGGIMVVPRDMDVHHFTPVQRPADDKNSATITTHFDYHSISSRLVKLDILGHDDPTVIKMLEDLTGLDAKTIPFDDKATMSLFSSTGAIGLTTAQLGSKVATYGIPEFGTKFVRQMLEDTMPQTFSELVRISGFSHGTDVWLNNAQDLIRAGTAKLSEAISARDDIMVYLMQKGVDSQAAFKIMEDVRKGKGIKEDYAEKMREKNIPEWYIESCRKIKYMFPKAHAVAYVMMAFRIAYCKVHYPLPFYASYFTVRANEFDASLIVGGIVPLKNKLSELDKLANLTAKDKGLQTILEMALEMYLRGFTFERVDLYQSHATKFIIQNNGLLPPLAALQGLGDTAAHNIVEAREGRPFSSAEDLRIRGRISKTVIDIMREHGCLAGMQETDQVTLFA